MKHHLLASASAALLVAVSLLFPAGAHAQDAPQFQMGAIPPGHIFLPEGEPQANVFLISDAAGWGSKEEDLAKTLLEKGATVVGVDLPSYVKALSSDPGDCIYMISDIEALAQQMQRARGASRYNPPVLAGIGDGGALALAMIAQSPDATIGEAIAVNPKASIPLQKILCTPARKTPIGNRMAYDLTDGPLPAAVTILLAAQADADGKAHAEALKAGHPDIAIRKTDGAADDVLLQALSDRIDAAAGNSGDTLGMPLTLLEAKPSMDTMAVIYSGDGGWRDIDSEVGGALQRLGVPVVGVDSLRYFWSKQDPGKTASDLSRIIDTYSHQWKVRHVLLIGYSFGADVLPATYNLLPPDTQSRVSQISLMALSHEANFEISVEGWLGGSGSASTGDPAVEIAKIDPEKIQCIYGKDDEDDACAALRNKGMEIIGVDGGHHFDGDYEAMAGRILGSLKRRLAN